MTDFNMEIGDANDNESDPTFAELVDRLERHRFQCPPSFGQQAGSAWFNAFVLQSEDEYDGLIVTAEWDETLAIWSPRFVAYPGEELREVKR